jgi:regulator of protease activity HflC (stomatin/prohibitin superfamily)
VCALAVPLLCAFATPSGRAASANSYRDGTSALPSLAAADTEQVGQQEVAQPTKVRRSTGRRRKVVDADSAQVLQDSLAARVRQLQAELSGPLKEGRDMPDVTKYIAWGFLALLVLLPILLYVEYRLTLVRAYRTGAKRLPIFFGFAELILWDPGETVVLLRKKELVAIETGAVKGGIKRISPWLGDEYRGRLSSKTMMYSWQSQESDPILTSDGLPIHLGLGILWRVVNPRLYVSRISTEYHESGAHVSDSLLGAVEEWLSKIAAGTLREQVNQLPAQSLISPYAQAYIHATDDDAVDSLTFAGQIAATVRELDQKMQPFGVEIERIEVQKVALPAHFQEILQRARETQLEPMMAKNRAEATRIRRGADTDADLLKLQGLSGIIGREGVRAKEVFSEVNFGAMSNPLIAMNPLMRPLANTVQRVAEQGLADDVAADAPEQKLLDSERKLPASSSDGIGAPP